MTEEERDELSNKYHQLLWGHSRYEYSDVERAINMLREAVDIAERLDATYWEMDTRHWLAQLYIYRARDYAKAVPLAVESAVEARKPEYEKWRTRICLYQDLIAAYIGRDPLAHDATIEQALQQMEAEAPPNSQCVLCLARERFSFEAAKDDWEAADKSLQHRLSIANSGYHQSYALFDQSRLHFRNEMWQALADTAKSCQKTAEQADTAEVVVSALLYQAVAHLKLGDATIAADFFGQYKAQRELITDTMVDSHYQALIAYHRTQDDLPSVIAAQREQLSVLAGKGALRSEAQAWVSLCQLLKETDQLTDEVVANAQNAIGVLQIDGGLTAALDQICRAEI